jgi:hypothetical protein
MIAAMRGRDSAIHRGTQRWRLHAVGQVSTLAESLPCCVMRSGDFRVLIALTGTLCLLRTCHPPLRSPGRTRAVDRETEQRVRQRDSKNQGRL